MARKTGSHSEITGPKIKQAALELFARHGFAAVTMRQIAARVGVQAGAIYNYTPDKQALLFDLLHGHMADLLTRWAEEQVPHDPVAALESFCGVPSGFSHPATGAGVHLLHGTAKPHRGELQSD
jgi:AcrR family transcriptional regulator